MILDFLPLDAAVEALLVVVWVVHVVEAHGEADVSAEEVRPLRQIPTVRGQSQGPGRGRQLCQQEQENTVQGHRLSRVADRGARRHRGAAGAEEGTTMITTEDAAQVAVVPRATVALVAAEAAREIEEATAEKYVKGVVLQTGYEDLGVGRIRDLTLHQMAEQLRFRITGTPDGQALPGSKERSVMKSYPPGGCIVDGPETCHRCKTKRSLSNRGFLP